MPRGVAERLLHQPIDRGLGLAGEPGRAAVAQGDAGLDLEARRGGAALRQRLDRGSQSELVERGRSQLATASTRAGATGGFGLRGMHERVELTGGWMTTTPRTAAR